MYNTNHICFMIYGTLLLLASTIISAQADEVCYDEVFVEAHMSCDKTSSNSADFTMGCHDVPAGYVSTVVECPPNDGVWVQLNYQRIIHSKPYPQWVYSKTHAQTCAERGMVPAVIDGAVCASGSRRPIAGDNALNITYMWDGWNSVGPTRYAGGSFLIKMDRLFLYPTMLAPTYQVSGWLCYNSASELNTKPYLANSDPYLSDGVSMRDIATAVACR